MCLMLCASPGKGLNIQYYKNKKHMFERINGASVTFFLSIIKATHKVEFRYLIKYTLQKQT